MSALDRIHESSVHAVVQRQRRLLSEAAAPLHRLSTGAIASPTSKSRLSVFLDPPARSPLHRATSVFDAESVISPGTPSPRGFTSKAAKETSASSKLDVGKTMLPTSYEKEDVESDPKDLLTRGGYALSSEIQGLAMLCGDVRQISLNLKDVKGAIKLAERASNAKEILEENASFIRRAKHEHKLNKAVAVLRRALRLSKTELLKMNKAWFRRSSRFKFVIQSLIEDIGSAISGLRIAVISIRSMRTPTPLSVVPEASASSEPRGDFFEGESDCMQGDKYFFGHGVPRSLSQAFECYKLSSELDYAPAMNSLASMYKNGQGVSRSVSNAIQWYTKSADRGCVDAINNLAHLQFEVARTKEEFQFATELFRVAANAKHIDAITTMGSLHEHGSEFEVIERDLDVAEEWYRIASDAGYDKAQNNLGYLLYSRALAEFSEVAERKSLLDEAVALLRLSADQGNATALNNLAICYELGNGVGRDETMAERLYSEASMLGNSNAMANTGFLMLRRKQYEQARRWLRRAIESSACEHPSAHVHLGQMYENALGVERCMNTAYIHYSVSAENHHPDGLFHAGECLLSGSGVRQDAKAAFQKFKESAEMGCNKAQNRMALLLEDGIGTIQDLNHAFYWLKKASADGHPDATYNLSRFYENGSGVEPDLKTAHELLTQAAQKGSLEARLRLHDLSSG